jgi:hypothetical protein
MVTAKLSYGVTNDVNVFCKVGMANFNIELKWKDGDLRELEGDYSFAWGLGGSGVFATMGNGVKLGGSAQYRSLSHEPDNYYTFAGGARTKNIGKSETKISEKQVAFYALYPQQSTNFYGGAKYSSANCKSTYTDPGLIYKADLKSKNNFGLFGGVEHKIAPNISCCVEVRLLDETAFSVGGMFGL